MSTAARIDELTKKFDENPRRYFAPLANELRKAGELAQAIALCREHLPKQPGHMSGYIVFGQALYESGALDEARSVFEQALALDPENLIALRHLGDIAKATGDIAGARRWYERVLDADPRNDDIASQLAALSAVPVPVSVRPTPMAVPVFATPPIPMQAIGLGALPTPDAALRAVDFDVVNARIAHYTPLDLDAVTATPPHGAPSYGTPAYVTAADGSQPDPTPAAESSTLGMSPFGGLSTGTPAAGAPSVPPPAPDTSGIGAPPVGASDVEDALGAFAAHDPTDEMQGDQFRFPVTPANSPVIEASAHTDAEIDDVTEASPLFAEAFEEGIMAPEWPDTLDLLARVSSSRSTTSPEVEITSEAVEAFGREPHDPEPLAEEIVDVTDDLATDVHAESNSFGDVAPLMLYEAENEPVEAAIEEPTAPAPFAAWDNPSDGLSVTAVAEPTELPWRAELDSIEENGAQRTLEEIADAFAIDARSVGDDADILVTSVEWAEGDGAEVSFADVLDPHDEDAHPDEQEDDDEELTTPASSHDSPAFVTETMAELLVSQGFISRAAGVYEELVRRHPYDPVLTSRLAELRDQLATEAPAAASVPDAPTPVSFVAFPTPAYTTPAYTTPAYAAPAYATSAYDTPTDGSMLVTPPFTAATAGAPQITARQRFAQLAARRVPRRTPPQPTMVVEEEFSGLSSIFGENSVTGSGDDAAARALADAFAPISEADAASGAMLDFGDTEVETGDDTTHRVEAGSSLPRPTPPGNDPNAGFSFDRFFPDPATQSVPPGDAEKAPEPTAPVGDDLAQFSAWLKGLGTT